MKSFIAAAALSLGSTAWAQSLARTCPETNVCYSLNIPESTASSGTGDVYFQITAPTTYEWVALGQGSGMRGANIFVIYTSADGQNVTVSPRLGTGHVEPEHNADAQITILGGSGVGNGTMTANVRCSSCSSWSGGTMDFTADSASWIHASKSGEPMNTDDVSAELAYHDVHMPFDWNMVDAKGGTSVNPFAAAAASGNTTASTGGSNSTSGDASFSNSGGDMAKQSRILRAHGVLASIAFVAIFPIGGIVVRVANFTGLAWIHGAIQTFGYAIFIAAFGLGVYLAREYDYLTNHHPIIGIVLFVVLFFQPLSGFLHHRLYKKTGGRTALSWEHIGIGRLAVILGMINGGLGIRLAGEVKTGYIAAYGVCAGVMGTLYIAAIVYGEMKRRRGVPPTSENSQRMLGSDEGSPNRDYHGKEENN